MEELDQSSLHPLVSTPSTNMFPPIGIHYRFFGKNFTEELASQLLIKLLETFRVVCFRGIHLPLDAVQGVEPEPERGVVSQADWRLDIVVRVHHLTSVVDPYWFWIRVQFFPHCGSGSASREPNRCGSIRIQILFKLWRHKS
jgi:hypothetical protein